MKRITTWINLSSIALIIIGLIHLTAIIVVAPMYKNLSAEQFPVFIFMYMATIVLVFGCPFQNGLESCAFKHGVLSEPMGRYHSSVKEC